MNKPTRIITHGGNAHRDELLSIGIVFAKHGIVPVERRDPTDLESEDPHTWVIDVGQRHEPELSNFDHHQFSLDEDPRCALTLILDHFNLRKQWISVYTWLPFAELLDTRGPTVTAKRYGMSVPSLFATLSPIEASMLSLFEQTPDMVSALLKELCLQMQYHVEAYYSRLHWLRANAEVRAVPGAGYSYIFIPRGETALNDPAMAMKQFRAESGKDIPVSVTPDPRGPGYGLFRFDDDERVDFTRLKSLQCMDFVHAGGFYATTAGTREAMLEALVQQGCGIEV